MTPAVVAAGITANDLALASGVAFWGWFLATAVTTIATWRRLDDAGRFTRPMTRRQKLLVAEDVVRSNYGERLVALALGMAIIMIVVALLT